jgi:anaerobic magnesium-protoporphyrin IX monomethyl ester cyclase
MLDAIIISDFGSDTFSASSPLRLQIDGRTALIQNVVNFIRHEGKIVDPVPGDRVANWHCAVKLNGIVLYDLLTKGGFSVAVIDSYYQERREFVALLESRPRAVVISTTFITNKDELAKLVRDIRELSPGVTIICGGPFIYASYLLLQKTQVPGYDTGHPSESYLFLNDTTPPDIDLFIVDRTGESILSAALASIKAGRSLDDLPNTARWADGRYLFSPRVESGTLDNVIDWSTLPEKFFRPGVINMQASTGCPYQCQFCNFVKDPKSTMLKPVDTIVAEMRALAARGVKYVRFVDDNFRLGNNDLNDVCTRLIQEGLDIKWMSFIRASTLDKTDIALLKQAGCIEAQIGIESIDEQVLSNMAKGAAPDMYRRVIGKLLDSGINCSCCFIFGYPGETAESVQRTIDFIEGISNDSQQGMFFWSIYPFMLIPLSPIYENRERERYGLSGYMNNWEHSTMNARQAYQHIIEAFMQIDSSGPIYSEDNLEMLLGLPVAKRKAFIKTRHQLSKLNYRNKLDARVIMDAFKAIQ